MDNKTKLKLLIILIAFIQPIIILSVLGCIESISMSCVSVLKPLFIFTNITTSFYFFQIDRWKIPSLMLFLLTIFPVDVYQMLHNILAISFFIFCIFGMTRGNYHKLFIGFYLLSLPIYFLTNFFWAEFFAVFILCTYHARLIIVVNRI